MKDDATDPKYHHGQLKDALVDLALAALEEKGPDELSLRELARSAGVSANAPYRHFADKSTLLIAVAQRGHELLADAIRPDGEGGQNQASAGLELEAMGAAYMAFARSRPALFRLMFSGRVPPAADAPAMQLLGSAVQRRLGEENCDVVSAALAAWCLVHGAAVLSLEGQLAWASESLFELGTLHRALLRLPAGSAYADPRPSTTTAPARKVNNV